MRVKSIKIKSFEILPEQLGGFVQFVVSVSGSTRFLHPLCFNNQTYPVFEFFTRYSVLLNVHNELKELFNESLLAHFPSKKWFQMKTEAFQIKRIRKLNFYFTEVLKNQLINSSEPIMRLISPATWVNVAVIGGNNVGKQKLILSFLTCREIGEEDHQAARCLPVDLIVDEEIIRIVKIEAKTVDFEENNQEKDMEEVIDNYQAAVFIYKNRNDEDFDKFQSLIEGKIRNFPYVVVNREGERENEFLFRNSVDAFNVFVELIRKVRYMNSN